MKMKHLKKASLVPLVMCLAAAFAVAAGPRRGGAPVPTIAQMAKVKAGDCAGCHRDKKVLPAGHVSTTNMTYDGCIACHGAGAGNPGPLPTRIPGSHLHRLRGIRCAQCHDDLKKPAGVPMITCVGCHGDTKALAAKTAGVKPRNPHDSRHYGTEADCNLCHHQHARSANFCLPCHPFNFNVP